ncbi:MAG: translation elongation factor-like protein [Candidatus Bathyarchaeia archaeon]|nr:translation elongation factor-like protein [Candidatus Bathyarchaeota archaeon]
MESLNEIGQVTHYYSKIGVAVVQLKAPLKVGDIILIKGATTNLEQKVESMEIEHRNVDRAEAGQSVGLKVKDKVREKDIVYRKVSS